MSNARQRERQREQQRQRELQRLGVCKRTGSLPLGHPDFTVTLTCIRTAEHAGRHQDPDFGPWSEA